MNVMLIVYTIFFGIVVFAMTTAMFYGALVFWKDYRLKLAPVFSVAAAVFLMMFYWAVVARIWRG